MQQLLKNAIDTCSQDECLTDERRESISKFACTSQESLVLFNNTSKICETFNEKRDAEFFFSSFFADITAKAHHLFANYPQVLSSMLMMQLGDIVFSYLSKPEVVEKPPTPISDKEIGALNYLSGYVVFKLLKKIRNSSKFNSFENQQFLNILECTLDKKGGNELIDSLSRGGLKTVTSDTLRIFYLAEEEFRKITEISNLRKINAEEIAHHDIVSIFKTVTDDVTDVTDETRENVLNKILHLYLRVRSYSLTRDVLLGT